MTRLHLPSRRPAVAFDFTVETIHYTATLGLHENKIAEIFLRQSKVDSPVDLVANDLAICMSLLLQHGIMLKEMQKSTKPGGLMDALIREIAKHEPELVQ